MKYNRQKAPWHYIWREATLRQAIAVVREERKMDDKRTAWKHKIRPRIIRKYGGWPYMLQWDIYESYKPKPRK